MMQELVQRPSANAMLTNEQLRYIASTDFIPKSLRGNLPAILACVATGRALGLPDMAALRSIHIVDGKATFSAELMVSLVRKAGHSITGEIGPEKATAVGKRGDNGDEMTSTWTLEMATRAGLVNKNNWKQYPESMLWARAVSQLCRMLFADVFAGSTYTDDEVEMTDLERDEEAVHDGLGDLAMPSLEGDERPDDTLEGDAAQITAGGEVEQTSFADKIPAGAKAEK